MPYYRRRTYRGRPKRRTTSRRTNYTTTRRIARTEAKKAVYRSIESKRYDLQLAVSTIDYSGFVTSFTNAMTEGTSDIEYIGDKIRATHLCVRGNLVGADSTNMVRIMIVKSFTSTAPTAATLLQSVGNVRAPLSARDADYEATYKTLWDRTYSLVPATTSLQRLFKINLPGKSLGVIHFQDGGTAVLERGGIFMMVISDSAAASHPTIQWESRLHYKDA